MSASVAAYEWDFGVVLDALPDLARGVGYTVLLTVLCFTGSTVLGLAFCVARMWGPRVVAVPVIAVVELLRLTPLLAQIFWVYASLPLLTGIVLSPFWSGVVALTINGAAFTSEIFRSGLTSIDRGQSEAAAALGMGRLTTFRTVLLPQATRRVIPPLGSSWVSSFKDTALVAVLGVPELLHSAQIVNTATLRPLEIFTAVGVIYFLLAYPQARFVDVLYRRFRIQT